MVRVERIDDDRLRITGSAFAACATDRPASDALMVSHHALERMHRGVLAAHPDALLPAFPSDSSAGAIERYLERMARRPDIHWQACAPVRSVVRRAQCVPFELGVVSLRAPAHVAQPQSFEVLQRLHVEEDARVRRYASHLRRLRGALVVLDAAIRRQAHAARLFLQSISGWAAARRMQTCERDARMTDGQSSGFVAADEQQVATTKSDAESESTAELDSPLEVASRELGSELQAAWSDCFLGQECAALGNGCGLQQSDGGEVQEDEATLKLSIDVEPSSSLRFGVLDVGRVIDIVQEQLDAQLPALCAYMAQHAFFLRAWDQACAWHTRAEQRVSLNSVHTGTKDIESRTRMYTCRSTESTYGRAGQSGMPHVYAADSTESLHVNVVGHHAPHTYASDSADGVRATQSHSDTQSAHHSAARAHVEAEGAREAEDRWRKMFEARGAALRTQLAIFWAHAREELERAFSPMDLAE